jgi:hypothetical protein
VNQIAHSKKGAASIGSELLLQQNILHLFLLLVQARSQFQWHRTTEEL